MKTKIEIELLPFEVPEDVIVKADIGPDDQTYPLSAIDEYTLERMCDEFRDAVFKEAGKSRPPQEACSCSTRTSTGNDQ